MTMSSSGKSRKSKPASNSRTSSRSKAGPPNALEGVYSNPRFVHTLLSLVGTKCNTQVKNGNIYNGIFHTISQNMDVVVDAAHVLESDDTKLEISKAQPSSYPSGDLMERLIFKPKDIACACFYDVDLNFAQETAKSNGDSNDSRFTSNGTQRTLEPWTGGGDSGEIGGLEEEKTTSGTNGWGAEEMFMINQTQYGVKSSYDPNLPEYTTPLESGNSAEFEARKARAEKVAQEIEGSASYNKNINMELEEGTTEEEKFSSVVRDNRDKRNQERFQNVQRRGRGIPNRDNRDQRPGYHPSNMRGTTQNPHRTDAPESPTSPTNKSTFRGSNAAPAMPPRFNKGGYQGNYREDDQRGNRLHENTAHHMYGSTMRTNRQGAQGKSYSRNHNSPTTEYNTNDHHQGNSPQPSRNSSASMTSQPPMSAWGPKQSEVSTVTPSVPNARPFPVNKESSYSSVVQSNTKSIPPPSGGGYQDARMRQQRGGYRQQPQFPTQPQPPRHPTYPKGHTPPPHSTANPAIRGESPQQPTRQPPRFTPPNASQTNRGQPKAQNEDPKILSKKNSDSNLKELKEFGQNFKLPNDAPKSPPSAVKSAANKPVSHTKQQRATDQPPKPLKSIPADDKGESTQRGIPAVQPVIMMSQPPTHHNPPTQEIPPTHHQPSINIPSPRTTKPPSVNTVSAAAQFVPDATTQENLGSAVPPSGEAVQTPSESESAPDSSIQVQLNPDAKEFTPRFNPQKPTVTPTSPTHANPLQPGPATYYSSTGQTIPNPNHPVPTSYMVPGKPPIHKLTGQTILSPSPNDGVMVSPHMSHIQPTSAAHTFIGHQYPTQFVIAHPPHMQSGQPTIPPVQHYPVDGIMYPTGHLMQPTTPRGHQYNDPQLFASYQPHVNQQGQQTQPTSNYMQQTRPHSAHTPNQQNHIPPTSPASTLPPQNPPTQVVPQQYYQHMIAHPTQGGMHQTMLPNSPQTFPGFPPNRFMMVQPGGAPPVTPGGQQQYIQQAVVTTTAHMPGQYITAPRPYQQHPAQQVVPTYPSQQQNQ